MMRKKRLLLFLFGWLSGLAMAEASYDLVQLERLMLTSSGALQAGREEVLAARYAVESAAAFPNPELEYLAGTARARNPGGNTGDARSAALTQPLDMPWRRSARIGAAEAGLEAAEAGHRGFEAEVVARLRLRYYELLRRQAELVNAREDVQLMEGLRSRIALRVELGESPRFELIKAEAEMLNAQKVAQAAGLRVQQARSLLRQVVGGALPEDFAVQGSLREVPALAATDGLQRQLLDSSPDLARARAEMVRAERLFDLERAQRWPSLALKASYDEDPDVRTSKFGLQVTVPIWDRRRGPVGEAAAQLSRARHVLEAQQFTLSQTLSVAVQQYEIAQTQVTALESGIVRQAEAALKVAESAYRFGERGFIEVLDAQRVYRAARSELIAARFELAQSWVEIERLRALPGETQK